MLRVGREPGRDRRGLQHATPQTMRLVEPAEDQGGPAHRVLAQTVMEEQSVCRVGLEQLLALAESGQRGVRLPELCKSPGGAGDRARKLKNNIAVASRAQVNQLRPTGRLQW